ncbi:hypothetical protein VP1G_02094 [Cytospora mali]|uniref:Uncharacterized protein n=1 Tax=Cytospora mali TaxID=578113 RepID=A0A194USM6_CYTMA|nr:hypothetical protein VP1G_02094 [Valsa mali var. pyri (nom. inval.)]
MTSLRISVGYTGMQIGGWFSYNSQTDPGYIPDDEVPTPSIWEFDIDTESWNQAMEIDHHGYGQSPERPGAAAYCDSPTLNKSFVFEGHVWRRSDPKYNDYVIGKDMNFLEGMLVLDTSTSVTMPILTNISVPVSLDNGDHPFGPRMNGAMVHVPVGDMGILVFIGGQTTQNPTPYGTKVPGAAQSNVMIDNTFVDIYDIRSGIWFRQQTFGVPDIPAGRTDICTVLVVAPDNSSYNIYMVAGMTSYKTYIATEEIWVLTIPTFQWVLVHTRPDGRHDGQDVQTCSDTMPAEVFNLASQNYTGIYDTEAARRTAPVPSQVASAIGGTSSGGAQARTPKVWSDVYLQYVFNPSLERPDYTPAYTLANVTGTRTANSTHSGVVRPSKGAIIGGAVGGVVGGLLLVAILVIFMLRSRRKRRAEATASQMERFGTELAFAVDGNSDKLGHKPQIIRQVYPAELGMNMEPAELEISTHPVEMFAPPTLSEISASPISSHGTTYFSPSDASEISPGFHSIGHSVSPGSHEESTS